MVFRFFLFLFILLIIPDVVGALTQQEIESKVSQAIRDRHPDYPKSWWVALGNASPVIIRMYRNNQNDFEKINLLQGLGWYEDSAAIDFLKETARDATDKVTRNSALRTIGRNPLAEGEIEFISEYLEHENPHTRLEAAQALEKIFQTFGNNRAKELFTQFKTKEKTSWIKARLEQKPLEYFKNKRSAKIKKWELSSDFEGHWRGFWIREWGGVFKSVAVQLNVKRMNSNQILKGKIYWKGGALGFRSNKGSGEEVPVLFETKASPKKNNRGHVSLQKKMGRLYLFIDSPQWAGKIWLKK